MLKFFDKKPTSYLGIDLGTGSIKLVELESADGRPRLVTYGMIEIETDVSHEDSKTDRAKAASVLRSLVDRTGARSRVAVAALPNFSVFSSVISLPKLDEKKLAEAVTWEAKKFVPMPIENVVLDWKILEETKIEEGTAPVPEEGSKVEPAGGENNKAEDRNDVLKEQRLAKCKAVVRVLLTAAPKHLVERYVAIFSMAGLNLLSLETESFALSRSLVGNDPSATLIVDVGSITTDLTLVENRIPVLARSIDVGGKTITKAIADTLGVSPERAEQFKRDVGIAASGTPGGEEGIAKIINQSFGPVVNEMEYTLDLSKGSSKSRVEKILLTGGSSFLPSLAQYLTDSLSIKTFVANAWARVSYPKDLQKSLENIGPRMSVAIGLAMREIE